MTPVRVRNDTTAGTLSLYWPNAITRHLSHHLLRSLCQCAFCRAARLKGSATATDDSIRIVSLHDQGYGVQIVFSDGHDSGIYPWQWLHALPVTRPHGQGVVSDSAP